MIDRFAEGFDSLHSGRHCVLNLWQFIATGEARWRIPPHPHYVTSSVCVCMQMYEDIRTELDAGGRVYIVCPFVEQSKSEGLQGVKAAEEEFARLVVPPTPAISVLRGRLM